VSGVSSSEAVERTLYTERVLPEDQVVRYVRASGYDVAWTSMGSGPPVVIGGWWSSHLVHDWASPEYRHFVGRLAEHRTLIRYDTPGTGLSRAAGAAFPGIDVLREALAAVIDAAVGDRRVSVIGGSSGCPVALTYAAEHPESVDLLILYGGFLRGSELASPSDQKAMVELLRRNWGVSSRVLTDIFLPDATAAQRDALARLQRRIAGAEEAASALAAIYDLDATPWAGRVTSDTLVLHRRGDRAIRFGLGRGLADALSHATFEPLEGSAHFPWYGDADDVADRVLRFLGADIPDVRVGTGTVPGTEGIALLTTREREIMALIADGLTDAQIAGRLHVSPHTVHRHVANVRTKLGVGSRAAAAARIAAVGE
jgi:pimeloyl-ACP methyl ester carboxylesterase/DNA-binding CsgD family transcriptional regulator